MFPQRKLLLCYLVFNQIMLKKSAKNNFVFLYNPDWSILVFQLSYSCVVLLPWSQHLNQIKIKTFIWCPRHHCTKMKFSIKDCFSKCDQICSCHRSWSHLLKKSLMENFVFCSMYAHSVKANGPLNNATRSISEVKMEATNF